MRKSVQKNDSWRWKEEPEKKSVSLNWSIVPAYVGLIATAITIYFTSQNLSENEKWKKGEFIANQFEKFRTDTSVQFVSSYVDYYSRYVSLPEQGEQNLHRDEVAEYLFPERLSPEMDGRRRAFIRNQFDSYLDRISLFNRYETAKLIKLEDIQPYLIYQVRLLGVPGKEEHFATFQESLWSYIERYSFSDVQKLFCKMGYNIYPVSK